MTWKPNTAEYYARVVESLGGRIIQQMGSTGALLSLPCGHRQVCSISYVVNSHTMRCKACRNGTAAIEDTITASEYSG